ncbi:MAG: hypothetical protein M1380_05700 [Chloroflexi bacterium]|nr:hypothetical protein [Chloroflexota bacterium]
MSTQELDQPSVDFLILADRAEAVNGKLYMMGGGWDRISVADFSQPQTLSLAMGILVPWNATNTNHNLAVRIETQDATELVAMGLSFNAGRPPTLRPAESQRLVLAFQLALTLPAPGTYVVSALIGDHECKRVVFYALMLPTIPTAVIPPTP